MGIDFRTFGADSDVHVPYGVPFVGHHSAHLREQKFAVGSLVSRVGVGKMISDVTECQGTEYRIAECVYRHIRVAVSEQPECVLQLYSAEPQLATFHKTVHVIPLSYSHPFTIDAVSSAIISSSSVGMTTT